MPALLRLYDRILAQHLGEHRQMAFVAGARQVGKTTSCRRLASPGCYWNWDDQDARRLIVRGSGPLVAGLGLERLGRKPPTLVFDELHKFRRWKTFLKGLFDLHAEDLRIVMTGSSRLDVYRRGGDSLMGRYFLFRMHPLSVGELLRTEPPDQEIQKPRRLAEPAFTALWEHGGFPEPLLKRDPRFSLRWRRLRHEQLVREDIRDLTRIQELGQLEHLVTLLAERSATRLSWSNLAEDVQVAVDTIRRWIVTLCTLHHGFLVRPWFRSVARSLRKEPKWYLRDWSGIEDPAQRAETFVACHLLKAVEGWSDLGLGSYELRYLRDKEQREVDFLVVRNRKPWFLVEVRHGDPALSPNLLHFQRQIGAAHAFQVVLDEDYVDLDCFTRKTPTLVPARTLLSQLL